MVDELRTEDGLETQAAPEKEETMEEMMQQFDVMGDFHRGKILEGTIVDTREDGWLVDVGYKCEGFLPRKEWTHKVLVEETEEPQNGDKVRVQITNISQGEDAQRPERVGGDRQQRVDRAEAGEDDPDPATEAAAGKERCGSGELAGAEDAVRGRIGRQQAVLAVDQQHALVDGLHQQAVARLGFRQGLLGTDLVMHVSGDGDKGNDCPVGVAHGAGNPGSDLPQHAANAA